jgi:hypothetical protein
MAKNVERVRAAPDDTLLSSLVYAEVDSRSLDMQELVSILFLLFLAGGETTSNATADPAVGDRIKRDEENFLDRTSMTMFLVDERITAK